MSSDPAADILSAEQREAAARARLTASLQLLQARLAPSALAGRAKLRLTDAASNGAEAAKRNPLPVLGAGLAAGLFLARHRIVGLFRRKRRDAPQPPNPTSPPNPPKDKKHD